MLFFPANLSNPLFILYLLFTVDCYRLLTIVIDYCVLVWIVIDYYQPMSDHLPHSKVLM